MRRRREDPLQRVIDTLNKEIKRIEKGILALVESDDQWRRKADILSSVPGVGNVTAGWPGRNRLGAADTR